MLEKIRYQLRWAFNLIVSDRLKAGTLQALPFWFASLLTGLVAVGYTILFGYGEAVLHSLLQWRDWALFVVTPVCFFLAWYVVKRWAPNARGSGIPQVMAAIELSNPRQDKQVNMLLSLRIAVVKVISSVLMVIGGGAIGREGPTIQIAGSVFRMVNRWTPATWPKLSKQSFILTGAAAGLAAAFNTPLGGLVFAMEELARIHIRHFRTALFVAVIIAGLTAQALLGPYLYLGYPKVHGLRFIVYLGVAATAILAGILGSLMCKAILRLMQWKKGFTTFQQVGFLVAAGLLIASVAYFINEAVLGSGKEIMNTVLFTEQKAVRWDTVLWRMAGTILCFNTGAAGGVFAPSLAAGATVGSLMADLFDVVGANANILILSGMVGFLTGVTRTPFTSAILVLEMTDRHSVIFHLLLAALLSNVAAVVVDKHSFYEQLKKSYLDEALEDEKKTAHT